MSRVDLDAYDRSLADYLATARSAAAYIASQEPATSISAERCLIAEVAGAGLWRYGPACPAALLIVYAFVNRPSMLDLDPERSLVRRLLEQGLTVYLVQWREPTPDWPGLDLPAVLDTALPALLNAACLDAGVARLAMLGVCQGGTLALMFAMRQPASLAALITMVTPVDFKTADDELSRFAQGLDFTELARHWRSLPAALLDHVFLALKPFELRVRKYLEAYRLAEDPRALAAFLRMEQWIFGGPRLPASLLRDFSGACYQRNALLNGEFGDLGVINVPLLNIYASADHLVPSGSSRALAGRTSGAYQELAFAGGHIGIFVSRRAQTAIASAIAAWLAERGLAAV